MTQFRTRKDGRVFPLRILPNRSTKLNTQFAIIVPSTTGNKKLTPAGFNRRIESTAKFMSEKFGGDTSIRGRGGFIGKGGKLITERVAVVETSTTRKKFVANKPALRKFIVDNQKKWKQEQLAYKIEGDLILFPK